jgi:hypothetical protein
MVVARRLQALAHHQPVDAVNLPSVELLQEIRRLDPGRPNHRLGVKERLVGQPYAPIAYLDHARVGADVDTEIVQELGDRHRQMLGQGRQDARAGLNDRDTDQGLDIVH